MSKTFTVEGDIANSDIRTLLTTQGSDSAPNSVVPAGMSKIDSIIIACTSEGLADGAQSFFLRLSGNAIKNGEQTLAISAVGQIGAQASADSAPQLMSALVFKNVDIDITPLDTLTVAVEGAGTDTGTGHAVVSLIYA